VSEKSQPQVNWQPISALALIGSVIDGMFDDLEKQAATLIIGLPVETARAR